MTERTRPYAFQIQGARSIHRFGGRALLAYEMGLGKTFTSLLYVERHPECLPVVVVCPASVKWNWKKECWEHFRRRAEVIEGSDPKKVAPPMKADVYVINYRILRNWLPWLKRRDPGLIIIDECQYVKSRSSQRTKAVTDLCRGRQRVVALSGTPLTNKRS